MPFNRKNALSLATAIALFIALVALVVDLAGLKTTIANTFMRGELRSSEPTYNYDCATHKYNIEIISLDPLLIYIRNFLSRDDITGLLEAGENQFNPSEVYKNGILRQNTWYVHNNNNLVCLIRCCTRVVNNSCVVRDIILNLPRHSVLLAKVGHEF